MINSPFRLEHKSNSMWKFINEMTILLPVRFSAIHKTMSWNPWFIRLFSTYFYQIYENHWFSWIFAKFTTFSKKSTSQTLINRAFQKAIKPNFYGYNFPKDVSFSTLESSHIRLSKTEFYEFVYICMFYLLLLHSDRQICLKIIYYLTTL